MDVNPQMSKSCLPEQNNAQLPDTSRLALILPSTSPPLVLFLPCIHRGWESVFASLRVRECPCMTWSLPQSSR